MSHRIQTRQFVISLLGLLLSSCTPPGTVIAGPLEDSNPKLPSEDSNSRQPHRIVAPPSSSTPTSGTTATKVQRLKEIERDLRATLDVIPSEKRK